MKKIFLILSMFLFLNVFAADSLLDTDFRFIDTAFDGIKPATNEQFDAAIRSKTPEPPPTTFLGKLRTFFFGRRYGVTPPNQTQEVNLKEIYSEKQAIEEIKNGVFYIKLIVSIVGLDGNVIPLGNYKIKETVVDNQNYLVFYQGNTEYGKLKLRNFEDNLKGENDITYSRVDIVSDEIIRIVYSTLSETKCATAKVYLQN